VSELGPAETHLVSALQHLRGADADLRMCLTLLRQENREVPDTIQDAIAVVTDALQILES
jgi:hypothetical protein